MWIRLRRLAAGTVLAFAAAGLAHGEQAPLTRRDADLLQQKLVVITRNALGPAPPSAARSTRISEREVNAYLRYHARDQLPVGVVEPHIWILGDGRVAGRAIVDLDAVRKQKQRGWTDPSGYLTGRLPIQATGILKTQNGVGRLYLQSAEVSGVSIPPTVLQEIVSYYTRTPEQPQGVSLDAPFELPAAIREVRVGKGTAVIVQ